MDTLTELDVSLLDLSKEELHHEYNMMREKLKTTLDERNQKIHDLQRELTRIQSLEREYLSEIEILQSNERVELKKLKEKISDLQEEIVGIKTRNREGMLELEQSILKKDEEIEGLKLAANASCLPGVNEDDYDRLLAENALLKGELEELVKKLLDKEVCSNDLVKQLEHVTQERDEKVEEYNSVQENYKIKKEELIEMKELIETLQEKIILMNCELDTVKNKPSDTDSRGNSLFAEVNDRRVQLQNKMEVMKTQYVEMKNKYSSVVNEVTVLKKQNTYLTKQWNEDIAQLESYEGKEMIALKNRVKTLEDINRQCEELLQVPFQFKSNMPEDEIKCMESMMKSKDVLLEEGRKKQSEQSVKVVSLSRELHFCRQELREWKSKTFNLECELLELKAENQIIKKNNPVVYCSCKDTTQKKNENYNLIPNLYKRSTPKAPTQKPVDIDIKEFLSSKGGKHFSNTGKENDLNKGNEHEQLLKCNEESKNSPLDESIIPSILSRKFEKESTIDLNDKDDLEAKGVTKRKRCVKFADGTLEINETNTVKPRRRGVIISCPVVYISSEPADK